MVWTESGVRQKVVWCILFACVASGPYLLGVHGRIERLAVSNAYAFVAAGMLLAMWVSCYPGAAALFRRNVVWKACICAALLLAVFLFVLGLFEFAYAHALDYPMLQAILASDTGMTHRWALELLDFSRSVGVHQAELVLVMTFLCGVASIRLAGQPKADCSAQEAVFIRHLATFGVFLVGVFRAAAWSLLLLMPLGPVLIWGCLFVWILFMAGQPGMRVNIAALCAGELAFRVLSRLVSLPNDFGFEIFALVVSALCLGASVFVSVRRACHRTADGQGQRGVSNDVEVASLEVWEIERLKDAGLTSRELDVLQASIEGASSLEAAQSLGMQASTVRSYKGRICKKLGIDSFDLLIAQHSTGSGLFARDNCDAVDDLRIFTGGGRNRVSRLSSTLSFLCLTGCMSLLVLFLMPVGTLPAFWNSTWVMAYACAFGIVANCILFSFIHNGVFQRARVHLQRWESCGFILCAAACLAIRWAIEFGGTGFGSSWRLGLFIAVAGLVGFGLNVARGCLGSGCIDARTLMFSCASVAVLILMSTLLPGLWYAVAMFALLCVVTGAILSRGETEGPMTCYVETAPVYVASWFVIAFIWEDCWRGVVYVSLQKVGIPFLAGLMVLDVAALLRETQSAHIPCLAVVVCALFIGVARGVAFGLLVGSVLLEVQVLYSMSNARRESGGERDARLPPALLGAAAGCCVAVYVANTRGSFLLLFGDSILPANFDWAVLCCFAASVVALLWRFFVGGSPCVSRGMSMDGARLEGYLVGKGLTAIEVRVCIALARGESVAQVAEALSYSLSAIGTAKRAAFAKLGISTRYQLMVQLGREFNPEQSN